MIVALQKRPLIRPLLVWIAGIVIQTYFPRAVYSGWLILLPMLFLICSFFADSKRESRYPHFSYRWVWGIFFLMIVFLFAIQATAFNQYQTPCFSIFEKSQPFFEDIRSDLLFSFNKLSITSSEKSVLTTLLLGYKEDLSWHTRRQFSATGVAHLLAVSGFHVAIVCGFISSVLNLLFVRNRWQILKTIILLFFLWFFVCLTGFAPSALRAGWMLSLYLIGDVLNRNSDKYNILAASAFFLLIYRPDYLFDVGFQLSYTAVFFILYLQPVLQQLVTLRNPVIIYFFDILTVTLAAQAGTVALSLYYFGSVSVLFLFTAIPVTFLSALLIPVGLLYMIWPGIIPGGSFLQWLLEALIRQMFGLIDQFSQLPVTLIYYRINFFIMIGIYVLLILLIYKVKSVKSRSFIKGLKD